MLNNARNYIAPRRTPEDMRSQIEAMQVVLATISEHSNEATTIALIDTVSWRMQELYESTMSIQEGSV